MMRRATGLVASAPRASLRPMGELGDRNRAQPVLRIEELTVRLAAAKPIHVVDRVSFALRHGRTLCLVGESGCGKSLTARAILRLVDPPLSIGEGSRVLFAGQDLLALGERALREIRGRDIAMIFQEPASALNPLHTVGEQVAEPMMLHLGLSRREALRRAVALFEQAGISLPERRIRQYPHELSGGMQQRVVIAMALACEPRLLIADEPSTALDVTIQAQILDLLREQQRRLDMAIVLITHDLGVVAEVADDIAVMYAGRIVEYGAADAVLATPRHPYTRALIASTPRLGMARDAALATIPGIVPSPFDWPTGCRFSTRCEHAMAQCSETPPLMPAGASKAACWLHGR